MDGGGAQGGGGGWVKRGGGGGGMIEAVLEGIFEDRGVIGTRGEGRVGDFLFSTSM